DPITDPEHYENETNAQTLPVVVIGSEGCEAETTLTLVVVPDPQLPDELDPLEECDADNDGVAEFDLQAEAEDLLNGQADVEITFHLTQAGAEQGTETIDPSGPYENTSPQEQTIWVRAENTGPEGSTGTGCYVIRPLDLIVLPSPEIEGLEDLYACDDGDGNGFAAFDLTENEPHIFGGGEAPDEVEVSYYVSQADAEAGENAIAVPGSYVNVTNPQPIWVRLENTETGCYDTFDYEGDNSFTLYVEEAPEAQNAELEVCDDDYDQDPYPQAVFNLNDGIEDMTGYTSLPANWEIRYFANEDEYNEDSPIANPDAYVNEANPQDV